MNSGNQNSMGGGSQHRLAFGGSPEGDDPNSRWQGVSKAANRAYVVSTSGGWLLYTRFHSCRAYLREETGWTPATVEIAARVLDGEVVL